MRVGHVIRTGPQEKFGFGTQPPLVLLLGQEVEVPLGRQGTTNILIWCLSE